MRGRGAEDGLRAELGLGCGNFPSTKIKCYKNVNKRNIKHKKKQREIKSKNKVKGQAEGQRHCGALWNAGGRQAGVRWQVRNGKGGPEGLPPLQESIGLRQGCLASWDATALPIRVASTYEARSGVTEQAPEPLMRFC